ncbi:MAG TPA: sigma-70 family RNA polymerase sigma factor [Oscillospiraceae bacterium]|nr:sigma-70 family RNA polymerase sigma factor [Oscillospiraceae bacterium]
MLKQLENERNALIENNIGLVHSCAKRFKGKGVEYDDLFQAGCVGLVKAAGSFDKLRGFAFSTYAVPAILGEIKRIFRDGGAIKIGRSKKESALKLIRLKEEIAKSKGEEPTVNELAQFAGISPFETAELLNAVIPPMSLTVYDDTDNERQLDLAENSSQGEMTDKISLYASIERLPEDEAAIIKMRYFKGMTQSQVAEHMSMSQVQISRKEKVILKKLRNILE